MRAEYKKALGIDIVTNIVAQIQSKKCFDVGVVNTAHYPSILKLRDCVFLQGKGHDHAGSGIKETGIIL